MLLVTNVEIRAARVLGQLGGDGVNASPPWEGRVRHNAYYDSSPPHRKSLNYQAANGPAGCAPAFLPDGN